MPRRDMIIFSLIYLACCGLYFVWSCLITQPGFPLDDSWIHQVFARNIASGNGFSFNPGVPVAGATAPLWTCILALFAPAMGPVAGGIVAGVLFGWLALVGFYKLTRLLTEDRRVSLISTVLATLSWPVIWGILSGMEVGLYSALTFWGLLSYFRSTSLSDRYSYLSYILFTLAFLARPECALFLAAVLLRDFYEWIKGESRSFFPWLVRMLIILLPMLPYFIFNYWSAGSIFPITYTAKVQNKGLIPALINLDLKRIIKSLTVFPLFYLQDYCRKTLLINPVVVLAVVPGLLKLALAEDKYRSKRIMLVFAVVLYIPLIGVFAPLYSATFQNFRMAANIIPLIILSGAAGLFWKVNIDLSRMKKPMLIAGFSLIIIGLSLGAVFGMLDRIVAPLLVNDPSELDPESYSGLNEFARDSGYGIAILGAIAVAGYILASDKYRNLQLKPRRLGFVAGAAIVAGLMTFIPKGGFYADNVRNVNECDVAAGRYLREITAAGETVAANDIGAIGYFSGREIFDLKGLVSPEITPEMIENDSLAFEYMYREKRVDYLAIAPNWFDYIPLRTDIFEPIFEFITENNTILAGDTTRIYRASWPDSTQ